MAQTTDTTTSGSTRIKWLYQQRQSPNRSSSKQRW